MNSPAEVVRECDPTSALLVRRHGIYQRRPRQSRYASAPPEIETIASGPESCRFHHIHSPIEVLPDPKRFMSVASEGDCVATLPPPPAQQVHRRQRTARIDLQ